jgi:cyclic pyranopterin phosphate synthase
MRGLSHLDDAGAARMVDVSAKDVTVRTARARARVTMGAAARAAMAAGGKKGDALQVARIAGIQAAKRTSELIPLCHPLPLDAVLVDIALDDVGVVIEAECRTTGRTGVEMEAMTAVAVAALTIYDMGKAVDRGMVIEEITLLSKDGGKSGPYRRPAG